MAYEEQIIRTQGQYTAKHMASSYLGNSKGYDVSKDNKYCGRINILNDIRDNKKIYGYEIVDRRGNQIEKKYDVAVESSDPENELLNRTLEILIKRDHLKIIEESIKEVSIRYNLGTDVTEFHAKLVRIRNKKEKTYEDMVDITNLKYAIALHEIQEYHTAHQDVKIGFREYYDKAIDNLKDIADNQDYFILSGIRDAFSRNAIYFVAWHTAYDQKDMIKAKPYFYNIVEARNIYENEVIKGKMGKLRKLTETEEKIKKEAICYCDEQTQEIYQENDVSNENDANDANDINVNERG